MTTTSAFDSPATYQYLVDGTLVERALMYQVPVALFLVSVIISNTVDGSTARKSDVKSHA